LTTRSPSFVDLAARAIALMKDRNAVTTLEYAVIAAVTVVATGVAFAAIGGDLTTVYTAVENALTA
jgi:Flp pilus assembly pilin Flp